MIHWWSVAALAVLLGGPPPTFPGHSCAGLGPAYVCVGAPVTPEPVFVHYNLSTVCNISVKDGNFTDCASTRRSRRSTRRQPRHRFGQSWAAQSSRSS